MKRSLGALAVIPVAGALALGQQKSMEQDPSLNNLVHPPGYETAPPGTFGHVEKRGSGPVDMVLVPGGGFAWKVFEPFMERHESDFTMYAVTLAGMGGTPAPPMPPEGTSYGEQTWIRGAVRALRDLITREKLDRPVIAAHFLEGAHVALRMAVDHPEMMRAAIILGGSAKMASPQREQYTLEQVIRHQDTYMAPKWFKTVTLKTWNDNNFPPSSYSRQPELGRKLYEQVNHGPLPVFVRYLVEFWSADPTLEFDKVKKPVLALTPSFSQEYKKEMDAPWLDHYFVDSWKGAEEYPLIRKKAIENAHIFVWLDQPEAVDEAIREFLRDLPGP